MDVKQAGMTNPLDERDGAPDATDDALRGTTAVEVLRYRDAYRRAMAELADLRAVARPDVGEVDRLKREMAQIKRHVVATEQAHAAQAGELQNRLTRAEAHVAQLTARIAEMERSTSWRLTAPVRGLSRLVRRLRGGGPAA